MSAVRERPQGIVEVRWRQTPGFVRFLSFDVRLGQDPGGMSHGSGHDGD